MSQPVLSKEENAFFVNVQVKGIPKPIDALIDTGAKHSFVSNKICIDNKLDFKGAFGGSMCIHGLVHNDVKIPVYETEITVGSFTRNLRINGLSEGLTVGSKKIEAVLGRDVLENFVLNLNWITCTGKLEN